MDSTSDAYGDIIEYEPANLVDGRRDTSWQVAGTGVGERVELRYEKPIKVSGVGIIPGYDKTDTWDSTHRFYQMYVIRKVRIEFSDGSSVNRTFEQKPEMQLRDMPDNEITSVRLLILETYPPGNMPGGQPCQS